MASGGAALTAAGVALETDIAALEVDDAVERALALAVREGLTNVIRHARAQRCTVKTVCAGPTVTLTIEDDGIGGSGPEGAGLEGMRDRLAQVGGSVTRDGGRGTRLILTVPRGRSSRQPAVAS